ncbi:hypothetical protein HRbin27_01831 [bacterium HR27]|nr:hypothetical protein HRbin27_01831 [bacterium HR27]
MDTERYVATPWIEEPRHLETGLDPTRRAFHHIGEARDAFPADRAVGHAPDREHAVMVVEVLWIGFQGVSGDEAGLLEYLLGSEIGSRTAECGAAAAESPDTLLHGGGVPGDRADAFEGELQDLADHLGEHGGMSLPAGGDAAEHRDRAVRMCPHGRRFPTGSGEFTKTRDPDADQTSLGTQCCLLATCCCVVEAPERFGQNGGVVAAVVRHTGG